MKSAGNTLGGICEVVADGLPVGLGSHVSWDRKLDGRLGAALLSIPAVKGMEIGLGMEAARRTGAEVHDEIEGAPGRTRTGNVRRRTNRAGGTEGGMTTGEPLVVRVAMKPISTLMRPLGTVDVATGEAAAATAERSDVTAVPAMGVIAEGDGRVRAGAGLAREVRRRLARRDTAQPLRLPVANLGTHRIVNCPTGTPAQEPGVARTVAGGVVSPRAGAHLVLVGLPGAGKTSVGRHLAERLRAPFLDFDEEIERRQGKSVARIFDENGEVYFRKLERELTEQLQGAMPQVLAPGGGWVLDPANLALLRPPARIIHLRVGIETAITRLGTRRTARPLLAGDRPAELLAALQLERAPLYSAADAEVNTETIAIEDVTQAILALAAGWGWPVG